MENKNNLTDNKINYKYILNKIFTGSFLDYNLGHEIINFIKMDDNSRYIYVNPYGERSEQSAKYTEYVFHIMGIVYKNKRYYELTAVSKVSKDDVCYKRNNKEEKSELKYKKFPLRKIFKQNNNDNRSHLCTFKAANFYKPKKRILFLVSENKPEIVNESKDIMIVKLTCNPQHSRAYSREKDIKVLDEIINKYLIENNDIENWDNYEEELCFSLISDRTKLENSMSNQIAYFFNRDKKLLNKFVKEFLKINVNDNFKIIREKENIDLLLEGDNNIIVIENKIDSGINGNQLVMYEKYIKNEYEKKDKYFYILEPHYSSITEDEKNKNGGEHYKILYYEELYKVFKNAKYRPAGKETEYGNFLFKEFIYTIEYIKMSKTLQQEKIAYTRLKQRISELEVNHE